MLNLSNEFLQKFSASLCQKLGVEEQHGVQLIKETVSEFQAIIAEEESHNVCKAVVKAGDNKGNVCGKKFKDGQCPVHKPHLNTKKVELGPTCELILKNGVRSGQLCGKKCVENEVRCAVHMRFPMPGNGCTYMFSRGERSGQTCDKKRENDTFCEFHKQAQEKSASKPKKEKSKIVEAVVVSSASDLSEAVDAIVITEKKKSAQKEKKPKEKSEPKKVEYEQMRCVRRGDSLVIKGTQIAVNDTYQILGWVKNDGSDDEPKWTLMKEYYEGMEDAVKRYGATCEFKASIMVVEEE
jgi:hypothetical protein